MNKLYFLRHFATKNNINGIISGNSNVDVADLERKRFSKKCPISIILCSSLNRCIDTMECYINDTKFTGKYTICDDLKERDMGCLNGKSKSQAVSEHPMLFERVDNNIMFNVFKTPPNGESYFDFRKRVERFIDRTDLFSENYLICSHNQTLKMIYHIINRIDITLNSWRSLNFENGEVYEIENDKWRKI